jgi:hypothetical protein
MVVDTFSLAGPWHGSLKSAHAGDDTVRLNREVAEEANRSK